MINWKRFSNIEVFKSLRVKFGAVITTENVDGSSQNVSLTELNRLNAVTEGTVTASKAVVVDANKDITSFRNATFDGQVIFGVGATGINADSGTVTAVAGAATLNKMAGVVTSEALVTAAGADYTLTLTNSVVTTGDMLFVSVSNGTNTTEGLSVNRVQPNAGSVVIHVRNTHATVALNGTIKICFFIVKS